MSRLSMLLLSLAQALAFLNSATPPASAAEEPLRAVRHIGEFSSSAGVPVKEPTRQSIAANPSSVAAADPLWYKDAVIYEVHVKDFFDSDGNGYGDFRGLTGKLDYIQKLGVNCIWLLPFYPSPLRDDGYDVADYRSIHQLYGNFGDFRNFMAEAHRKGIHVIIDFVLNHTSDQHPWFQAARKAAAGSPERDYYVWSDTDSKYKSARIIFTDTEKSNWTWDPVAKAYFWHRFFSHQPDLNYDNPQVLKAMMENMGFWFDLGIDGVRLDAAPYLIEREGTNCENLPETHNVLKEMRKSVGENHPNCILLAESNQWAPDLLKYFGNGDECQMAYNFPLMPRIFMAIGQEDRQPIIEQLNRTATIPPNCQWGLFLRNHDELTLEMVTPAEREYMYKTYAPDPRMHLNVGIRRRLSPLLNNDRSSIELLNSLLFSLPGTPIIYYGDELGMRDNIQLNDRDGVRTPMQWTAGPNGGFSSAEPSKLYNLALSEGPGGYKVSNVEAEDKDPASLLNWMRKIIALRNQHKVFGRGSIEFLKPESPSILAFVRKFEGETVLVVSNLSRKAQSVELDLSAYAGATPVDLLGGKSSFTAVGKPPFKLEMAPHGYYWLMLKSSPRPSISSAPDRAG